MDPGLTVVGIGEALFDRFGDRYVLGGAPVNVAVHAHQLLSDFGGGGEVVSRVGDDRLGARLRDELTRRGVGASHVQTDPERTTGIVHVSLDRDRQPTYTIAEDVAWDHLEWSEDLERLAAACGAVCFGTLAQRSPTTRSTIHRFLRAAGGAVRVFDPNLRPGLVLDGSIRQSLENCTVLKLNEDELDTVASEAGVGGAGSEADDRVESLLDAFGLRAVALTRGARGTVLYTPSGRLEAAPGAFNPTPDADGVGAGDACGAGLIAGLLLGWSAESTLGLANQMGAFVASRPGATPRLLPPTVGVVTRPARPEVSRENADA